MSFENTKIPKFRRCVLQNFPFIEADFDALTDYQLICKVVEYLNKVIDQTNSTTESMNQLNEAFIELKNYVDHYFDNLDVQEEINNKLDAMAEAGTLRDIILAYLNDTIKVIFPCYKMDGSDTNGDCTIVKTANKSIMIDCFYNNSNCYSGITDALYENGISELDYFIITHYDADHYGNYQRLIAGNYITQDTRVILPKAVLNDYINKTGSDIKEALETAGIPWIEADNQSLTIDGITLNIYNGSTADYEYYDSLGDIDYNNYSLCIEVLFNGRKVLIPGDCQRIACEYITPRYLSGNYDLIKDNHHSFCGYDSTYANTVNPDYVVCPTSVGMINANIGRRGSLILAWTEMTKNIYVQGVQPETLVMTVGVNGVKTNKKAIATIDFGSMGSFDYYLDATTTSERRDGSQEFPFKSLAEANAMMAKRSRADVILHVVNLDDLTTEVRFTNFDRLTIDFDNESITKPLLFSNINMLKLSNITTSELIKIENCRVNLYNITTSADDDDQIILQESDVVIRGDLTSTNAIESFIFVERSTIHLVLSSLDYTQANDDARIFKVYESNISLPPDTETILSAYKPVSELTLLSQLRYFGQHDKICSLFEHTTEAATDTITLRESISDFDGVKVLLKNNDNYCTTVEIANGYDRAIATTPLPSGAKDTIYWNLASVIIDSNNTQMHLGRACQFVLTDTGITHSSATNITIMRVIGIPK